MSFVVWTRLRGLYDVRADKSLRCVKCSSVVLELSRRMAKSQTKWGCRSMMWNAVSMNWTGWKWCRYPILYVDETAASTSSQNAEAYWRQFQPPRMTQ